MSNKEVKEIKDKEMEKEMKEREILMRKEGSWNDEEGIYGYTFEEEEQAIRDYRLRLVDSTSKNEKKIKRIIINHGRILL